MFLGHYAAAFAAKRAAPRTSLGLLFLSAQWLDLIWPLFLLRGVEHVAIDPGVTRFTPLNFYDYPWSHSLLAVALWSLLLGGAYFVWKRDVRGALVVSALVLSHWLLDLVVHRPDLPLTFHGDARLGLGLWNSIAGTLIVEFSLFLAAVVSYARQTRPLNGRGAMLFSALITLLLFLYIGSNVGPEPPSVEVLAWSAMALWIVPMWGWGIDRNRTIRLHRV